MSIQKFKEILALEINHLSFMQNRYKIGDNISIKAENAHHNDWGIPSEIEIEQFDLSAIFHGEHYNFSIKPKYIKENNPIVSFIESLDEGSLISSFEEALEGEYWEHIKAFCARFQELEILDYSE